MIDQLDTENYKNSNNDTCNQHKNEKQSEPTNDNVYGLSQTQSQGNNSSH